MTQLEQDIEELLEVLADTVADLAQLPFTQREGLKTIIPVYLRSFGNDPVQAYFAIRKAYQKEYPNILSDILSSAELKRICSYIAPIATSDYSLQSVNVARALQQIDSTFAALQAYYGNDRIFSHVFRQITTLHQHCLYTFQRILSNSDGFSTLSSNDKRDIHALFAQHFQSFYFSLLPFFYGLSHLNGTEIQLHGQFGVNANLWVEAKDSSDVATTWLAKSLPIDYLQLPATTLFAQAQDGVCVAQCPQTIRLRESIDLLNRFFEWHQAAYYAPLRKPINTYYRSYEYPWTDMLFDTKQQIFLQVDWNSRFQNFLQQQPSNQLVFDPLNTPLLEKPEFLPTVISEQQTRDSFLTGEFIPNSLPDDERIRQIALAASTQAVQQSEINFQSVIAHANNYFLTHARDIYLSMSLSNQEFRRQFQSEIRAIVSATKDLIQTKDAEQKVIQLEEQTKLSNLETIVKNMPDAIRIEMMSQIEPYNAVEKELTGIRSQLVNLQSDYAKLFAQGTVPSSSTIQQLQTSMRDTNQVVENLTRRIAELPTTNVVAAQIGTAILNLKQSLPAASDIQTLLSKYSDLTSQLRLTNTTSTNVQNSLKDIQSSIGAKISEAFQDMQNTTDFSMFTTQVETVNTFLKSLPTLLTEEAKTYLQAQIGRLPFEQAFRDILEERISRMPLQAPSAPLPPPPGETKNFYFYTPRPSRDNNDKSYFRAQSANNFAPGQAKRQTFFIPGAEKFQFKMEDYFPS